jgi:hypothetical protein
LLGGGCGPATRRDLASVPQQQVTYDDLCHLQDYFDQRATAHTPAFRVMNEQSTETSRVEADEHGRMRPVVLGEGTYRVRDRSDRLRLRQLLREEYRRLPDMRILPPDTVVDVHVSWWQSGTIRRLRPDADVEIVIEGQSYELPFQPCVGEFLFGDEPYTMRRNILAAERARAHGEIPTAYLTSDASPATDATDATASPATDVSNSARD